MGKIRKPKSLSQLLNSIDNEKIFNELFFLQSKYGVIDSKGRYLHWDEFQWRVKKGDNEDLAWIAIKAIRTSIAKKLSLQAEKDTVFHYCVPESLFAQLHKIDKLTGGGKDISDGNLVTKSEKNRYLIQSLIQEEAITSSQLEGASTTRKVAKEMLSKNLPPQDKSQQMILNNYLLMKKVVEKKDEELSIEFILELHKIAVHNAIENEGIAGDFRNNNNIFVSDLYNENSFHPPDYQTIVERLQELCEFANKIDNNSDNYSNFIHPIIKAIILHFMIAYIHPFADGNGRTARAIFYWSILKSGYWLFEYISISKFIQQKRNDYDKAFIYVETDEFDLTYFLYHQVDIIIKAINSLYEYIDRKKRELYEFMDWIENSIVAKTLNKNHLEILKEALKNIGKEFTAQQVANDLGLTPNTARNYLNQLVEKDLFLATKARKGKTIIYVARDNLKARLKIS